MNDHDEESLRRVRRSLAGVVRRSKRGGGYALLSSDARSAVHPGFFQGLSGLIYTMLRVDYPELLPSVLLLDPVLR